MTRARIFATLASARAARDALPARAARRVLITAADGTVLRDELVPDPYRWRLRHVEGRADGRGFSIPNPGNAAERIRARGVFTDQPLIVLRRSAAEWAIPEPRQITVSGAVDLDETWRDAAVQDGALEEAPV